jgi:tRNA-dihydrouridine synthase
MYGGIVHYDRIAEAVRALPCPILANGDIDSPLKALEVLQQTGARGVMIGRAAVRNPWLFRQIRQLLVHEPIVYPTGREVASYLKELYAATSPPGLGVRDQVDKFKKYLNFMGPGLPEADGFLYDARRMASALDLERLALQYLDHDQPLRLEPLPFR